MNSQTQQLVQYIQQQLKQGRTEDVIRNELEQSGWQKDAIDNAFQWLWQQSSTASTADSGAALPAPSDNPNAVPRSSNKGFKMLLIVAVLLILLLGAMLVVLPKLTKSSAKNNGPQTQQNTTNTSTSSQSENQAASDNNKRDSDAASVASAVSEFQNNNLGQLPQSVGKGDQSDTVKMCGDSCSNSPTNNDAILAFYAYSGISIKSYSSGLAKPTLKELFIVNGAVCNTDKTWVTTPTEQQSSSRIVAFLYAKQSGSKTTYSCADL